MSTYLNQLAPSLARQPAQLLTLPTYVLQGTVEDDAGNTILDMTGDNAERWPGVMARLSQEQNDELYLKVRDFLTAMLAGENVS